MNLLPMLTLDALQAGGLLALAAAFGADGLHRRDRLTGWLGLCCLLVALRHGVGILDAAQVIPLGPADRLQSALASLGYLAMMFALGQILPSYFDRRVRWSMVLGMVPNLVRCVALPLSSPTAWGFHMATIATYVAGCLFAGVSLVRARRAGDPFGNRLLGGLAAAMVPLLVEIYLRVFHDFQLRISGVGIILMAISLGASWLWVLTHDLHERLGRVESEASAWRGLLPGSSWHTEEESPLMEDLFGTEWRKNLEDRMVGSDGASYLVHRARMEEGAELGWLEVRRENDARSFLRGWTVALGLDEGEEFGRIAGWLHGWGAHVEPWGTVPPRNGPYPSVLVWMREPSILAVWRERDLARRRCRWVQVGGPRIEGPHLRLDRPLEESALQAALQKLVVLHR